MKNQITMNFVCTHQLMDYRTSHTRNRSRGPMAEATESQ